MSTAMTIVQPQEIQQWKSPTAIKNRIQAIQKLMAEVLKPATKESGWDGDFGIIPGTGSKPSLLKSGSEQILAMFEIAVDPIVEDLSTDDCCRFRVTARLTNSVTGNFLGAGIGEASTNETKYKWKRTYSQKEWDNTDPDRRKIKYSQFKNGNGMFEDKQELLIRTEPADLANTVLKMAKKRAQIDATLTVTGASSMFSQDLEEDAPEATEPQQKASGKKAKTASVKCEECKAEGGHLPSCKHHPKNVSSVGQPTPAQPTKEAVKGEVMPKETTVGTFVIKGSKRMKRKNSDAEYLILSATTDAGDTDLFVWHKHLHEYLENKAGIPGDFETSTSTSNGKIYVSIEHIKSLNGVPFVDDKPTTTPSAQDLGFEPPEEEF